jgi:hypothetical protein
MINCRPLWPLPITMHLLTTSWMTSFHLEGWCQSSSLIHYGSVVVFYPERFFTVNYRYGNLMWQEVSNHAKKGTTFFFFTHTTLQADFAISLYKLNFRKGSILFV